MERFGTMMGDRLVSLSGVEEHHEEAVRLLPMAEFIRVFLTRER
jgi:hypothetical protein